MALIEEIVNSRPENVLELMSVGPVEPVFAVAAVPLVIYAVDNSQILVIYLLFLHPAGKEPCEVVY